MRFLRWLKNLFLFPPNYGDRQMSDSDIPEHIQDAMARLHSAAIWNEGLDKVEVNAGDIHLVLNFVAKLERTL